MVSKIKKNYTFLLKNLNISKKSSTFAVEFKRGNKTPKIILHTHE